MKKDWVYAWMGECSSCGLPDKRLWRPRPSFDDGGRLRYADFHPVCVRCRIRFEVENQDGEG